MFHDQTPLAIVLAGGEGSRMDVLTEQRAKPAMPFAGVYRLIDIPMSNLRNSDISDVWVIAQYQTQSISDILAHGRPWDLDRTHGGFRLITPEQSRDGEDDDAWHDGNADALYQARALIRAHGADVLLVLSADHVYRLDYREVIQQHLERGSDVTIVTTEVPIDQASNHAVVESDEDGRVSGFAYKPDDPASGTIATEIFVYSTDVVLDALETIVDREGEQLEDFGHQLMPHLIEHGRVDAFALDGYWKDLGRPETYFEAHMDLLRGDTELELDDKRWPIFTLDHQRMPARIGKDADISCALISPGCVVHGRVTNAVLGPGVYVAPGAEVRDAVVLHDTMIESGATVCHAIIDRGATIESNATVTGGCDGACPTTDELVLVGAGATVKSDQHLEAGDRVAPVEEVNDLH